MNIDCVISSCSFGYSKLFSINVKEITAMRIITAQKPNCSFSNDYKKNTIAKIIATPTQSQMLVAILRRHRNRQQFDKTMQQLTIYIFGLFLMTACKLTNKINPDNVESVALIQTTHPYIGDRVDSIKLDDNLIPEFLSDFADKKEEVTKFYSCYVIKIRLEDGQLISYRTNGQVFEKFNDYNTTATYFKLNQDINLVSKYWKIPKDKFCATRQITTDDIKGNWYFNKWTMYHTLKFFDTTLFVDNHIDSVFYCNYSMHNDTLILRDNNSTVTYKEKIIALTQDTLIIKSFGNKQDILGYSRTKRAWTNE